MTLISRWRFGLLSVLLLIVSLALISALPNSPGQPAWKDKIDPWLLSQFSTPVEGGNEEPGQVEFLVSLADQADLSGAAALATRAEKGAYVYQRLTEHARRTQAPLLAELTRRALPHRSFWIANLVWVRGDLQDLQALALRADVGHIYPNPSIRLSLPGDAYASPGADQPLFLLPAAIEWNIDKVLAPQVWAAGFRGQGAVIGGQDTGYQWDHPALIKQYRGWDGVSANHAYNWHDAIHANNPATADGNPCGFDSPVPCDDHYHGTHTMGTMVGDDGAGNQIGMAPAARWIGCRNMEQGVGTPATYIECFQWFTAPTDLNDQNPRPDLAPDVINNSWTCPPTEGCSWDSLESAVSNARAAGIVVVVAASNYGSSCETIKEPPAIYQDAFSVGATDVSDLIAGFSSRGPVTVDGSNRIKPEVSAPGVSIRSSTPGGSYTYLSGTSMAAPHVAGLVALLLSAQPALRGQVDSIQNIIEQSAVPLTSAQACGDLPETAIPNNAYGSGRIDAWSAYLSVQFGSQLYLPMLRR